MTSENNNRIILFVVGMHRSGTSAITAALSACGASTGDNVIPAQEGVNDEGFWENRRVVELNEAILKKSGMEWYLLNVDEEVATDSNDFELATQIITDGFGNGQIEVVKDPRFCITLPFWLGVCRKAGVDIKVCVIERDWHEIAQSLHRRDDFPLNYSYELAKLYDGMIKRNLSEIEDKVTVTYDDLLENPDETISEIISNLRLPLGVNESALENTVNRKLKHNNKKDNFFTCKAGNTESQLLSEMARQFVERGRTLTKLGEEHSEALEVIRLRDQQLTNIQQHLEELGQQHGYAISIVEQRDKQLAEKNTELAIKNEEIRLLKPLVKILRVLGLIKRIQEK